MFPFAHCYKVSKTISCIWCFESSLTWDVILTQKYPLHTAWKLSSSSSSKQWSLPSRRVQSLEEYELTRNFYFCFIKCVFCLFCLFFQLPLYFSHIIYLHFVSFSQMVSIVFGQTTKLGIEVVQCSLFRRVMDFRAIFSLPYTCLETLRRTSTPPYCNIDFCPTCDSVVYIYIDSNFIPENIL